MGTSKQSGVDTVSTVSLLGCGTSVAFATDPTDEEEELHMGHMVAQLVDTLCCKPEGRGFDSQWCQWNFLLT